MPRIDLEAPENEHAEGKDGKKRIGGTLTAAVTGEGILDGLHSGAHRVLFMVRLNSAAQSIGVEVVQFNSDQGSQFTSPRFTPVLKEDDVKISMDGKGRWMDNVFIERLWRSLKYECDRILLLSARPHSALAGLTPDEAFAGAESEQRLAA